jgi:hypothetical protein
MTWGSVLVPPPAASICSPFAHIGAEDEVGMTMGGVQQLVHATVSPGAAVA